MVGGGLFFVVCGNEKGPVSSMGVDGTGLDGVLGFWLFACGAVALESSGGGG